MEFVHANSPIHRSRPLGRPPTGSITTFALSYPVPLQRSQRNTKRTQFSGPGRRNQSRMPPAKRTQFRLVVPPSSSPAISPSPISPLDRPQNWNYQTNPMIHTNRKEPKQMSFSKRTQFLLGAATLAGQSRKPRCPPGALRFLRHPVCGAPPACSILST